MTITFFNPVMNGNKLTVEVSNVQDARRLCLQAEKTVFDAEIGKHKDKRSLDANGYFWALCEKLAQAIGSTKIQVYRNAISDVGIYKVFRINDDAVSTFQTAWESLGIGWITEVVDYNEDGTQTVFAYYGSSTYNKKQMARLIDNIVQDCKACEIETMPPDKLALMLNEWKPKAVKR